MRELFSLTTAECRLAAALLQGSNLQQATETLEISRNTAHSQLRGIFDKTRTSRQAELIRVLGGALVGVARLTARKKAA